ncbi:hypothetical protein MPTK1_8g09270 [Marchantia polymorpha subsp. ruderalis]|uniref:Uncharacterized protein n=1 Tax=Marchantia polymorpha TaxID=3197 RepID=A0A2R6W2G4_MARPO|nr:hypothetical protein MARPO_0176s0010 [Marchantia polymorpha]BBN19274.1 hypothetical protein Mp_8g09270 [Marchantia polymorpha subsp. ruderalis]|eukprot:PTQ28026.1 hypothetical protein MARPO_0176s0010 [Marchantia polymorpha]
MKSTIGISSPPIPRHKQREGWEHEHEPAAARTRDREGKTNSRHPKKSVKEQGVACPQLSTSKSRSHRTRSHLHESETRILPSGPFCVLDDKTSAGNDECIQIHKPRKADTAAPAPEGCRSQTKKIRAGLIRVQNNGGTNKRAG